MCNLDNFKQNTYNFSTHILFVMKMNFPNGLVAFFGDEVQFIYQKVDKIEWDIHFLLIIY